jgi:prophage antirepressor-like protein
MSNIVALAFEQTPVRTVERSGEIWWVLIDVCKVLEIGNHRDVARRLDDDEKGVDTIDTLGGPQQTTIVSEAGLYAVIQQSRKPIARRFDRWVRHDVLPQIRRTGNYIGNPEANVPMQTIQAAVEAAVAPIHAQVVELSIDQRVVRDVVVQLFKDQQDARQRGRHEFSKATINEHLAFRHYEGGLCPICVKRRIVDPNGVRVLDASSTHHISDRGRSDTWNAMQICNQCHDDVHASPPRISEADFQQIAGQYQRRFMVWKGGKQADLAIPPVATLLPRYTDQTRKPEARPATRKPPVKVGLSMFDLFKRCGDAS